MITKYRKVTGFTEIELQAKDTNFQHKNERKRIYLHSTFFVKILNNK